MNRILTFHYHGASGAEQRMAPSAYYIDAEYDKVRVRLYAEKAPIRDAKFDILENGVSIFDNMKQTIVDRDTGAITRGIDTNIVLPSGSTEEELADNFNDIPIEEGSWVYCNLMDAGGGSNFTVQLELKPLQ